MSHHATSMLLSRRAILASGAAAATAAVLAACSNSGSASGKASGAPADGGKGKVTLVAHNSFKISDELKAEFEKESGYTLEVVAAGDGGETLNKLILTKDAPIGDCFFGIDNTFISRALGEGIVDESMSFAMPDNTDQYLVDGNLAVAPIDVGDVCVNVDTEWFKAKELQAPKTFEDLTDAKYKDLFCAINPATSTPGLAFMIATVGHFGADKFGDYWKSLKDNGTKIDSGWEEAYFTDFTQGGNNGTYPIVVSYSSSPAFTVSKDGETTTAALLDTAFRQIEYAGVLKGAANPEGGRALVSFLLGAKFQESIPAEMYMYPVDQSVPLPKDIEKFGQLSPDPVKVTPDDISANRESWIQTWTESVGL
ncbi:thiamine ABC transporter substrate-binding protein [Actinomyces vulturis]|uniref:thiamine ABC transporter substrate-binding protein n=1 Tax=Actinomyces vulturis TaxID=1857645 RepID=UPI00083079D1|nr:thiamine ABC transporter substrate-binding protein [Actinomyces vulturis]